MIRAFIGIRIDPKMAQRIAEVQSQLKESFSGIRWVEKENLHLTLKFLGGMPEEKVEPISEALKRSLREIEPFSIFGRGIGVFPDIRRARTLWVGLEGKPLASIAVGVERALEPIGFPMEAREFKAHLTIGRWRNFDGRTAQIKQVKQVKQEIERLKSYDFGESRVEEVVVFQSVTKPEGAVYSPLKVIVLRDRQLST